jgi:MFS family permease
VSITIGIIYGYAVGMWLYETFPEGYSWKYTYKFATIFGVGMFFGMLYLPESPRWLVSSGRPLYEALEAAQFVNSDLTSEQIVNMKKEIERQVPTYQREDTAQNAAERLFCSPAMRIPMIVGMGLIIGQQVTGLPAMLYYCVDIFEAVSSKVIPVMEHLFCGGWMLLLRDHVSSPV